VHRSLPADMEADKSRKLEKKISQSKASRGAKIHGQRREALVRDGDSAFPVRKNQSPPGYTRKRSDGFHELRTIFQTISRATNYGGGLTQQRKLH